MLRQTWNRFGIIALAVGLLVNVLVSPALAKKTIEDVKVKVDNIGPVTDMKLSEKRKVDIIFDTREGYDINAIKAKVNQHLVSELNAKNIDYNFIYPETKSPYRKLHYYYQYSGSGGSYLNYNLWTYDMDDKKFEEHPLVKATDYALDRNGNIYYYKRDANGSAENPYNWTLNKYNTYSKLAPSEIIKLDGYPLGSSRTKGVPFEDSILVSDYTQYTDGFEVYKFNLNTKEYKKMNFRTFGLQGGYWGKNVLFTTNTYINYGFPMHRPMTFDFDTNEMQAMPTNYDSRFTGSTPDLSHNYFLEKPNTMGTFSDYNYITKTTNNNVITSRHAVMPIDNNQIFYSEYNDAVYPYVTTYKIKNISTNTEKTVNIPANYQYHSFIDKNLIYLSCNNVGVCGKNSAIFDIATNSVTDYLTIPTDLRFDAQSQESILIPEWVKIDAPISAILEKNKYRDDADKVYVRVDNNLIKDFSDTAKKTKLLTQFLNNSIDFVGMGSSTNKTQMSDFIKSNNNKGLFIDNSNLDASFEKLTNYIINKRVINLKLDVSDYSAFSDQQIQAKLNSNVFPKLNQENIEASIKLTSSKIYDKIIDIKCSIQGGSNRYSFCLALSEKGSVYSWGGNDFGQLGDGTYTTRWEPKKLDIDNIIQIDAGYGFSVLLNNSGKVYVFGDNSYGQLGLSKTTYPKLNQITLVNFPPSRIIKQIDATYSNIVLLDSAGIMAGSGMFEEYTYLDGTYTVNKEYFTDMIGNVKLISDENGGATRWFVQTDGNMYFVGFEYPYYRYSSKQNKGNYGNVVKIQNNSIMYNSWGQIYLWSYSNYGAEGNGNGGSYGNVTPSYSTTYSDLIDGFSTGGVTYLVKNDGVYSSGYGGSTGWASQNKCMLLDCTKQSLYTFTKVYSGNDVRKIYATNPNTVFMIKTNGEVLINKMGKDLNFYDTAPITELSKFPIGISYTELNKVLSTVQFKPEANKYFAYLRDSSIDDFTTPSKVETITDRLKSEDIHFIGLGTSQNESQMNSLISSNYNQGKFINNSNLDTALNELADHIIATAKANDSKIKSYLTLEKNDSGNYVSKDIDYDINVTDYEKDLAFANMYNFSTGLSFENRWKYTHDPSIYENNSGAIVDSGLYRNSPYRTLNKVGSYLISVQAKDDPKNGDTRFTEYPKWSQDSLTKLMVYVHRQPEADFSYKLVPNGSAFNITLTDASYDLDHMSQLNKGIVNWIWKYKELNDTDWTDGKPTSLLPNKLYTVSLMVKDMDGLHGTWSKVVYKEIDTGNVNHPPQALFTIDPNHVSLSKTFTITDLSSDPDNNPIIEWKWTVKKEGNVLYTGSTKPTTTSIKTAAVTKGLLSTGTYSITLEVKDSPTVGLPFWSEPYTQEAEILNHAPLPAFTMPAEVYRDTLISFENKTPNPDEDGDTVTFKWTISKDAFTNNFSTAINPTLTIKSLGLGKNAVSDQWQVKLEATDSYGLKGNETIGLTVLNHDPTASIQGVKYIADQNDSLTFSSNGTDQDTEDVASLSSYWKLTYPSGSLRTFSTSSITHTFDESGIYTLEHWVKDQLGAQSVVDTKTITINSNLGPTAGFIINPTTAFRDQDVNITSTATDPDSFIISTDYYVKPPIGLEVWFTGDEDWSNIFSTAGIYTVRQKVMDDKGATDEALRNFTIINRKPTATISYPSSADPLAATIDYSVNPIIKWIYTDLDTDPQSAYTVKVYNQASNTLYDQSGVVNSTAKQWTMTKSLVDNVTYRVEVEVFDGFDWNSTAVAPKYIKANLAPTVSISYPTSTNAATPTLSLVKKPKISWIYSDPENNSQAQYRIFVINNTTDVVYDQTGLLSGTIDEWTMTKDLQSNVVYYIKVDVYDGYRWNNVIPARKYIMLNPNSPPVANFDWSPKPVYEGDKISIVNTSTDPDGDILSSEWTVTDQSLNVTKYYTKDISILNAIPGVYKVNLKVTDPSGMTDSIEKNINVIQNVFEIDIKHNTLEISPSTTSWEDLRVDNNRTKPTFYAGEPFIAEAKTSVNGSNVKVDFLFPKATVKVSSKYSSDPLPDYAGVINLTSSNNINWSGKYYNKSFYFIPDGTYTVRFTATYANGTTKVLNYSLTIKDSGLPIISLID